MKEKINYLNKENGKIKLITLISIICIIVLILLIIVVAIQYFKGKKLKSIENSQTIQQENENLQISSKEITIKGKIQKYLDLMGIITGSPEGLLVELRVAKTNSTGKERITIDGQTYIESDAEYDVFEENMLKYVSKKCFDNEFKIWYKNIDGIVYYSDKNVEGRTFQVLNIEKLNDTNYIVQVNEIFGNTNKVQREFDVTVVMNNGEYVIDKAIEKQDV